MEENVTLDSISTDIANPPSKFYDIKLSYSNGKKVRAKNSDLEWCSIKKKLNKVEETISGLKLLLAKCF